MLKRKKNFRHLFCSRFCCCWINFDRVMARKDHFDCERMKSLSIQSKKEINKHSNYSDFSQFSWIFHLNFFQFCFLSGFDFFATVFSGLLEIGNLCAFGWVSLKNSVQDTFLKIIVHQNIAINKFSFYILLARDAWW